MAIDYGDDQSTFGPDGSIDIDFEAVVEGPRVVLEAVARRWLMSSGALPWSPVEGVNVLRMINADPSPTDLYRLGELLEGEALQEPGVVGASVRAELRGGVLFIVGRLELAEGSFLLTVETGEARRVLFRPLGEAA